MRDLKARVGRLEASLQPASDDEISPVMALVRALQGLDPDYAGPYGRPMRRPEVTLGSGEIHESQRLIRERIPDRARATPSPETYVTTDRPVEPGDQPERG